MPAALFVLPLINLLGQGGGGQENQEDDKGYKPVSHELPSADNSAFHVISADQYPAACCGLEERFFGL